MSVTISSSLLGKDLDSKPQRKSESPVRPLTSYVISQTFGLKTPSKLSQRIQFSNKSIAREEGALILKATEN